MEKNEIKRLLLDHLERNPQTQWTDIRRDIDNAKKDDPVGALEEKQLLELVHEFISSNILMTGIDASNTGWPWLSVTTHGEELLSQGGPPVYDYDGYMKELTQNVGSLDKVIDKYIRESLRAYQANLLYASMVMLGCASERAIILLIDSYINAIDKEANQKKLKSRITNRNITTAYEEFKKSFDSTKDQIESDDLKNDFDIHVDATFNFIKLLRNSVVHPESMPTITSALVYANLQQFHYYIGTITELIKYFKVNKIVV